MRRVLDLQGQVALISGVGGNIGLATARRLASLGATLAVSDLQGSVAERAAEQVGGLALSADIRQGDACRELVHHVLDDLGRLDILVNTAGRSSFGALLDMSEEAWRLEIDTNLTGSFLIGQAAARAMVPAGNGGRIILFGSTAAESARAGGASHCASKAGVQMLVKVMALELAPHGITVNAVAPGLVPHPGQASDTGYREAFKRMVPLGRLGQPEDVAGAVAYLASDAAAWVTGEVLHVDGGFLAGRALPPTSTTRSA
jgi:NAD(P)-dependent dehydrogenase (short-subunit alcohol dehydrogenase family)